MPPRTAQIAVFLTGFMAFLSIIVAAMLALRLDQTRTALHHRLQQCACCDELQAR